MRKTSSVKIRRTSDAKTHKTSGVKTHNTADAKIRKKSGVKTRKTSGIKAHFKKHSSNFDYKAIFITVLLLSAVIIVARGCLYAINQEREQKFTEKMLVFDNTYTIKVYNHNTDKTAQMPLDEYIFYVVAAEMPASYNIEALKAQAVAARTYAAARMEDISGTTAKTCPSGKGNVCTDSSCCQSWKDAAALKKRWGADYLFYTEKIYNAVVGTSNIIAVYDGKPIDAMYHSVSGGRTEDSENLYDSVIPYLRGVESPGEETDKNFKTSTKIKYKELIQILNDEFDAKLTKSNIQQKFKVLSRYDSGRVDKMLVGNKTVSGRDMRKVLSIKSSNYDIEFTKTYVIITTIGYGHGVGMSQSGANAMAKNGATFTDILTHYYSGITICNIGEIYEQNRY